MSKETYCAIIADIIDSRKMNMIDRKRIQEILIQKINEANNIEDSALAAYFDFSAGDQIQALFNRCEDAYCFACKFREEMYPILFRFGLGVGDWTIRYPKESSNRQDGSAYHNARHAIDSTNKMNNRNMLFYSGCESDAIINTLIASEERIFSEQTGVQRTLTKVINQHQMIMPAPATNGQSIPVVSTMKGYVSKLAEELNTSHQNIYQNIKRGRINEQKELQAAIILLMKQNH